MKGNNTMIKKCFIWLIIGILFFNVLSCDPNATDGGQPSGTQNPKETETPTPSPTPDLSRKLEITATINVQGYTVDASKPIWIYIWTGDSAFKPYYKITSNGGTIKISNVPENVRAIHAMYDPAGQKTWTSHHINLTADCLFSAYENYTYRDIFENGEENSISIAEQATESVSITLGNFNTFGNAVPTTGDYSIEVYSDDTGNVGDSKIMLFDSSFNLLSLNDNISSNDPFSRIDYSLQSGQTYYIKVFGGTNYEEFGYTLAVYDNSGSRPAAAGNDFNGNYSDYVDSFENNNDYNTTAETLAENTPKYRIIENNDVDWFKITL